MKTQSTIKTASALFSAAMLLSLSGQAAQNFSVTSTKKTTDYDSSNFGAMSTFNVSDNYTLPTATSAYTYGLTATETVTGKIPQYTFTAANGTATIKVTNGNQANMDANLKVAGITVMTYNNQAITNFESPHFIKEVRASKTAPFNVWISGIPVPFVVNVGAKASIDGCLQAKAVFTPNLLTGLPKVSLSAGPVVDLAASAEASMGVGVPGFSAGPGVEGTIKIASTKLMANVDLLPRLFFVGKGQPAKVGLTANASLTAQLPGITGNIGLFVYAEAPNPFGAPFRFRSDNLTIASFAVPAPAPVTLLSHDGYRLF